jgi:hypothetical protein
MQEEEHMDGITWRKETTRVRMEKRLSSKEGKES